MLCKVWQINVLYFVSVQFIAKLSMFFKVRLKKKNKTKKFKDGFEVFEKERNYGEAFAPWQGNSNKNTYDLCHQGHQSQKYRTCRGFSSWLSGISWCRSLQMAVFTRCKLVTSEFKNVRIFFIEEDLFTPFSKLDEVRKGSIGKQYICIFCMQFHPVL